MQDGDDWLSPLFQKVAEELGYHGAFHLAAGEHVAQDKISNQRGQREPNHSHHNRIRCGRHGLLLLFCSTVSCRISFTIMD